MEINRRISLILLIMILSIFQACTQELVLYDRSDSNLVVTIEQTPVINGTGTVFFGDTIISNSTMLTVTVSNKGPKDIYIDGIRIMPNPVWHLNGPLSHFTLTPGSTNNFIMIYSPKVKGANTGTMYITNDSSSGNLFSFTLTGNCRGKGNLTLRTNYSAGGNNSEGLCISPDGRFIYVASHGSGVIYQYARSLIDGSFTYENSYNYNSVLSMVISSNEHDMYTSGVNNVIGFLQRNIETGELTTIDFYTNTSNAYELILSPDERHLYFTSSTGSHIGWYSRNSATGELTYRGSFTTNTLQNPRGIVLSPDGAYVYIADQTTTTIHRFSRDAASGDLTHLGHISSIDFNSVRLLSISPDGNHIYASGAGSRKVLCLARDSATGVLTELTHYYNGSLGYPWEVTVSPDGNNVYCSYYIPSSVAVFTRDKTSGEISYSSSFLTNASLGFRDIRVSPDGRDVYVVGNSLDSIYWFSREYY